MSLKRPVFLNGMMGAGKSTLGRAVAARASVPFVDLDVEIEARAGMPIRQIFEEQGETAFRVMERTAVAREIADPAPRVVAVGGGSLLGRSIRLQALERGLVLTLMATPAELIRRLAGDGSRPLLGDEPTEARVIELLEARASMYAEAHAVIDTTGARLEALTAEVLRLAELDPIAVPLGERTYTVNIVPHGVEEELERALERLAPSRVVLVTDDIVEPLVLPRLDPVLARQSEPLKVVLPSGERFKTIDSVERILRAAVEAPVDRSAVVVGVGGGVVTDVAGLAAALALRGLRWIAVPTTVLAMVDASVGGKTAVDLGRAKNAVGAFHQPSRVLIDPSLSRTETERAFRSGLAEVVKTALIGDPIFFRELCRQGGAELLATHRDATLVTRAVRSSVAVKAGVVGRDERESGERAHLNLGHTIGHALEAEGGFERLTHGEAVSLGLVAALRIGRSLGVTSQELADQVVDLLRRIGLPVDLDAQPLDKALEYAGYDKKRQGGTLRFILVRAPGSLEMTQIAPTQVSALLRP